MSTNLSALVRMFGLALIALGVWLVCAWGNSRLPAPLPPSAPPQQFAAGRAEGYLARILGPERPHPVATPENAAVRARILKELAALNVPARTYTAFTCNAWRGFSFIACATVTDIIADVSPGQGKALVMMAHYDSVPAGPGASDDQSGVGTILETIRVLKSAGPPSHHPVIALFTDGEEAGLLGAKAFLDNPQLKARVGAVVNMEARGTSGQTLLFQTSAGDAPLLDLYAREAPIRATSSLYGEIYKFLPNDTDLTPFLHEGFPALNYAFVGDVRYYHSPRDTRANLDPASLQMHGDDLLGAVHALDGSNFASLKGANAVYISVLGEWLPRLPAGVALPLAVASLLAIAFAAWLARPAELTRRGMTMAAIMPLVLLLGCLATGFALAFLAQAISGSPDPTYAYPIAMRIALGCGVWGMTLVACRLAGVHGAATSAWLWMAGLAVITAVTLPGLSPYFLFPSIVAAVLLLSTARLGWSSVAGQVALLASAVAALVIWLGLATEGEALMGLKLHPLFTVPAAFGLMTLVPLLSARPFESRTWGNIAAACLVLALVGGAIAGLLPSYSTASPQRVNLVYFENGDARARWIADTSWKGSASERLPAALAKAAPFRFTHDAYGRLGLGSGYTASAGANRLPLPSASRVADRKESPGRIVSFVLHGSSQTDVMALRIPAAARITGLRVRGQTLPAPRDWKSDTFLYCNGRDCRDMAITLTSAARQPFELAFGERRYGLPDFGKHLAAARPSTAMPSQSGDGTILANRLRLHESIRSSP